MKNKEITWLKRFAEGWRDREQHERLPHAVLLSGPPGVGKRAAARWVAARRLGIDRGTAMPEFPVHALEHADLHWVAPLEEKHSIGIEQIRELVQEFFLTSYEGAGKVAIIEPANAMTTNAANSLLKTLEEPSGTALLVLVADRPGDLPATIVSRCQRIDFALPSNSDGLAWLVEWQPGANWAEALRLAGNAPLAAVGALEQIETDATMRRDFVDVANGRASPIDVADRWMKQEPGFVLGWLARQVQQAILVLSGAGRETAGTAIDESVLRRMDTRNLFCYLDTINGLRAQPTGSYNVQLALEGLLIDWAEHLEQRNTG